MLFIITSREYLWWRNLRGGAEVGLVLRGKVYTGHATISLNPDDILNVYRKMVPMMSLEQRERYLDQSVIVTIMQSQ